MKLWKNLLIGGCLISFVVLLGFFNATKPRILVLHSGSQDSPWVREVDRGMRIALQDNRRPISIEWMYMDAGSPSQDRGGVEAVAEARRAISRTDPDVLIAVDDEANALVARDYSGRDRPRIVYVSLDHSPTDYGYSDASNVSGIAEQLPWNALQDALASLFPGRSPRLAIIGVDNPTGRAELAQALKFDWGKTTIEGTALVSTAGAWREFVVQNDRADALLVLSAHDLPDGESAVLTAADLSRWTQEHARPLPIGTQVGFVESGGALSFSPPPEDYGEKAVRLVLDWLDDRSSPGPPKPVESTHFEVAVRQGALTQRGYHLPPIYLEAARESGTLLN